MVHVAQEMERQEFRLPLLIGGATTSRAHTAVKIAPHYRESVVHVLDASRAVGVVSTLLESGRESEIRRARRGRDYERLREEHADRTREKKMLTARAGAGQSPNDRLDRLRAAGAGVSGSAGVSANRRSLDCAALGYGSDRSADADRLHRLVAVFSYLGIARTIPGDFGRSKCRGTGARAFCRRAETFAPDRRRRNCSRRAAFTASGQPTR